MDSTFNNGMHECEPGPPGGSPAGQASVLATFLFLGCVPACTGGIVPVPSTPTAYRLTFTPTDDRHPPRTISATIDWRNNLFIAGMNGRDASVNLVRDGTIWHLPTGARPTFPFTLQQPVFANVSRVDDDLFLEGLSLRPTEGGCVGSASGGVSHNYGGADVGGHYEVASSFDCVADHVGPGFSAGGTTLNPVDLRYIGADEYVAPSVSASLVDPAGNTIALTPTGSTESPYGTSRLDVAVTLAFGSTYTLVMSGTDLAGNTGTSSLPITVAPAPGLLAQDGFEGPVDAVLSHLVEVVDAPVMAIPSGRKALAFQAMNSGMAYARFTARLQAPPGATAVKASYVRLRGAAPDASSTELHIAWTVGLPNAAAIAVFDKGTTALTADPLSWAIDSSVPGQPRWISGPQTLTFPLPAPATGGEVVFDVLSDQFTSTIFRGGDHSFLLDDLRVE